MSWRKGGAFRHACDQAIFDNKCHQFDRVGGFGDAKRALMSGQTLRKGGVFVYAAGFGTIHSH
jgi:hypothetical protein